MSLLAGVADVEIEVLAEAGAGGRIDGQEPAVEELREAAHARWSVPVARRRQGTENVLVEVVLARAAVRAGGCCGLGLGHALHPSVVVSDSKEHVAAVVVDEPRQEEGTLLDVVVGVLAVAVRCSTALVLCARHVREGPKMRKLAGNARR